MPTSIPTFDVNKIAERQLHLRFGKPEQYTTTWRVIVTSDNADEVTEKDVIFAEGVPELGSFPDEEDNTLQLSELTAKLEKPSDSNAVWLVEGTLEQQDYSSGNNPEGNPLNEPPEISFPEGGDAQKPLFRGYKDGDARGNPSMPLDDSAGTPFAEPLLVDGANFTMQIVRNEQLGFLTPGSCPMFSLANIMWFRKTINKNAITIGGASIFPFCGKMKSIVADPQRFRPTGSGLIYVYMKVTYVIECTGDTWLYHPEDQGFNILDGGNHRVEAVKNGKDPIKLDGSGHALSLAEIAAGHFHYRTFRGYWEEDWKPIGLPASLSDYVYSAG